MQNPFEQPIIDEYIPKNNLYKDFSSVINNLLVTFLRDGGISFQSISFRAKEVHRLRKKIQVKRTSGKIYKRLEDITDLSGVRVLLYFQDDCQRC
ncbi:MAG: hypothetical protein COU27_01210 [Candidatus Levybacteria bacterium CG10_big_fil_rev_8_21_14_0_10_36_7]|nr:MAG: hypothetical protein COU27_01210 [Candidatus Levybacteria bacterium CG10_big_fil_rev_8_21_14_0_10_36_7]